MIEHGRSRALRNELNTDLAIIGDQRVRHSESAARLRLEYDASLGHVSDNAVLDGQGSHVVDLNPRLADASTFNRQPAQADDPGGDGDANTSRRHDHARSADPVIDDAD